MYRSLMASAMQMARLYQENVFYLYIFWRIVCSVDGGVHFLFREGMYKVIFSDFVLMSSSILDGSMHLRAEYVFGQGGVCWHCDATRLSSFFYLENCVSFVFFFSSKSFVAVMTCINYTDTHTDAHAHAGENLACRNTYMRVTTHDRQTHIHIRTRV